MAATHEDRNAQLNPGVAIKTPCRVATTGAITLSAEQTIDGVACIAGDRVLVKNQVDQTTNGIYLVSTSTWTREPDFDGNRDVVLGTVVKVNSGTQFGWWGVTTVNPITFGSSNIAFLQDLASSSSTISFLQSGTGAVARTVQAKNRDIVSVLDFYANGVSGVAVDPLGVVDSTLGIQAAINSFGSSGGILFFPSAGTYLTDTLTMKSNVVLELAGSTLFLIPHSTTKNHIIKMGTLASEINHAGVRNGILDGNKANQTFPSESHSHGVYVWGSDYCFVDNCQLKNCAGDGATIGYELGRLVGSNGNRISYCEAFGNARQAISITWGNENSIIYNKCSGNIDLELDPNIGECKNNLVHGNKGRTQTESLLVPRISDCQISLATSDTRKTSYFGNTITDNHVFLISGGPNTRSIITGNTVVGSNNTQARLLAFDNFDDAIVSDNSLIANAVIATALTDVVRTRGCINLKVTDNFVANGTLPFHSFLAGAFSGDTPLNHIFFNNLCTGTGGYRNGGAERGSEWARYRIDQTNAGTLTATQIAGVPAVSGGNFSITRSGGTAIISQVGFAGAAWLYAFLAQCNATVAAATDMPANCAMTTTRSGGNLTVTAFTYTPAAGAVTLAAFSFASAGGTGTFFADVWF
jgi:hypothetical protein